MGHYSLTKDISSEDCRQIFENPTARLIILDEPLSVTDFTKLETFIFSRRTDITLSCFVFSPTAMSLNFIRFIPSVRHIYITVSKITDIESLAELKSLETLRLSSYNLDSFDFLNLINIDLKELYLYQTISSKPNLKFIGRFKKLKNLYLEGHSKNIEEIQNLKCLTTIVLRSVKGGNVNYLKGLNKLSSVDIKLGGIQDFSALESLANLKYLEIWKVRLLSDVRFISSLTSLETLFLQSLKNVDKLPPLNKLLNLKVIHLEDMKGLVDLNSIRQVKNLESFSFIGTSKQEAEFLKPVLENKSVKNIAYDFKSLTKNNRFKLLSQKFGKADKSNIKISMLKVI